MAQHSEHLWQAYIDGQLSAAEASEFEESLTPGERELLAADAGFERRLGEKLSQPLGIPEDIWQRTLAKVEASREAESPAPARRMGRWAWGIATLATAAMMAFLISGQLAQQNTFGTPSIVLAAADVETLQARAETEATLDALQVFLQERGVDVDVALDLNNHYAVRTQGHSVRFLGAGAEPFGDEQVVEMYFDCCHEPAKVLIAPRGSAAAAAITKAFGNAGDVQAIRDAGDYLIAVVGLHQAHDLLDTVVTPH